MIAFQHCCHHHHHHERKKSCRKELETFCQLHVLNQAYVGTLSSRNLIGTYSLVASTANGLLVPLSITSTTGLTATLNPVTNRLTLNTSQSLNENSDVTFQSLTINAPPYSTIDTDTFGDSLTNYENPLY